MPIKNLSDVRRLPRLGKIALGIKKKSATSGNEHPAEVDYFVCPPAVQKVFGEKPKELRIMFPVNNDEVFFQQWYKCYGASALKCKGDGERAWAWDDAAGGIKEIPCPCPKLQGGECKPIGTLQFLIPEVDGAGIWQITTSSKNSIIDINSSIDFIRSVAGRIHMIPLVLKREERTMTRTEDNKQKKSTHYTMKIDVAEGYTLQQLQRAAQVKAEVVMLPPADESKDDLLYPVNGFQPDADAEPEKTAKPGGPKSEPEGDGFPDTDAEPMATEKQIGDIAVRIAALRKLGKSEELIYEKIGGHVKQKFAAEFAELKELTVEMADSVLSLLRIWIANIEEKRKQASA